MTCSCATLWTLDSGSSSRGASIGSKGPSSSGGAASARSPPSCVGTGADATAASNYNNRSSHTHILVTAAAADVKAAATTASTTIEAAAHTHILVPAAAGVATAATTAEAATIIRTATASAPKNNSRNNNKCKKQQR